MSAVSKIEDLINFVKDKDEDKTGDDVFDKKEVLPSNVRPIHYFLSYTNIDLEKEFKFDGNVKIDLEIYQDNVSKIIINSGDITYSSITITQNENKSSIDVSTIIEDKTCQQITIPLIKNLNKGKAILEIKFIGILNDNLKGFYRSSYKLSSGKDGFCGCTQFEACDARLAFPCWDEPAAKATFSLQITYPKELICISNMPPIKEEISNDNKFKITTFDKTPKMSSYLLAWVIGEFEYIQGKTSRDIIIRIYTSIGNSDKAKYALSVAIKCLDFYESYFSINYPLPKCDMIALKDFAAGAMENWGLITYREVRLLCDENTVALRIKQNIARVICHELAHQWFGNLVTMDWWSQLWLNEGFASFMQYLSANKIEPDLNIWTLFMSREYKNAFKLDGMLTSHPIEVPVLTAKGADEVFDIISYCKGSCIIVMLQSFLGNEIFKNGLNKYLNKFSYSNAVTTDLWYYLTQASGKDIGKIMKNWTRCQGFPVVNAKIIDKKNGKILLKQCRYLSSGDNDSDDTIWNVPIVMKIDGKDIRILLDEKEKEFIIKEIKNCKYIHLNSNSKGFYLSQYDEKMLSSLLSNINDIIDIERLCLIRDLKALSLSGSKYMNNATQKLLDLIIASKNEKSCIVWEELLSAANDINKLIDNDEKYQNKYNKIMCDTLLPIYKTLNNEEKEKDEKEKDSEKRDVLRPLIIGSMAKYGNKQVINDILNKFDEFIDNKYVIPDALRSIIYKYALKNSNDEGVRYEKLKNYYLTTKDNMDKRRALSCLGFYENNIYETLNWVKNSDSVRKQDKIFGLRSCSQSKIGRDIVWKWLKESISEWNEIYDGGGFILNSLIKLPSSGFIDNNKANEIETFYNTLSDKGQYNSCQKSMKQCVEYIRLNAKWKNQEINNIQQWIDTNF